MARAVGDLVSAHFSVAELTDGRGWWPDDVEGEAARYAELAIVLEQARAVLGVPMRGISGARPIGHNDGGRASSMHLPPIQRAAPAMRYMSRAPKDRGAALDFIPGGGMGCDVAFRLLDAAMRDGRIKPGGLFWYPSDAAHPGPASGRFVHIDNRGTIARERALTPPK